MTTERRHDIDWLRVLAIGLLLIYHIAIIFQPWAMFVGFITSEQPLKNVWKPMTMLSVWRIPFLFYVSGMGLYFAMKKRNFRQLISERTKRILVPFIFGIVAIAPLHFLIFQKFYHLPLSYYPHAGHLWFLGNIFLYVLVLSPLFLYLMKKEAGKFRKGLSSFMNKPLGPLTISVFFVAEAIIVNPSCLPCTQKPCMAIYLACWHSSSDFFLFTAERCFGKRFRNGKIYILAWLPFYSSSGCWYLKRLHRAI